MEKSSISGLGLRHIAARLCYYMSENGRRDRWLMEKLFSLSLHTPEIIYGKTLDGINNVFAFAVLYGCEFLFFLNKFLNTLKITKVGSV